MTGRYKRMFEEDKKKNPKKYRFQPFKIIYKDLDSKNILFSPGYPSGDEFKGYADRGKYFDLTLKGYLKK